MGFENVPSVDWDRLGKINLVEGLIKSEKEDEAKKIITDIEDYITSSTEIEKDIKNHLFDQIKGYKNILGIEQSDIVGARSEIMETKILIAEVIKKLKLNRSEIDQLIAGLEEKEEKLGNIGKK